MRILVTYDPHNEAVTKTAKLVSELIRREGADVDLVDISQKEIDILAPYDRIVVGGELWFGKFSSAVQKYLLKNQEELLLKPTYIFMHAYVGNTKFQEEVAKVLPLEILTHAFTFNLGMNVDMDSLNPLDKIRWKLTNQKLELPANENLVKDLVSYVMKA